MRLSTKPFSVLLASTKPFWVLLAPKEYVYGGDGAASLGVLVPALAAHFVALAAAAASIRSRVRLH